MDSPPQSSQQEPQSQSHCDPEPEFSRPRTAAPPHPFPTTLADLQFAKSPDVNSSLYSTLKSLRRATLSIHNRLTSILADSSFVISVSMHYNLPLIANERCGSWYIPPSHRYGPQNGTDSEIGSANESVREGASVYFKSTDGHHGEWCFSLRRLNLQLLKVLGKEGGAVVVDSTRRGKCMPDALMKSVPIWVAVMNRVLFPERKKCCLLQLPTMVGESERSQIEARLEGWCEGFRGLGVDLEALRRQCHRPIRVVWAVNGEWDPETAEEREEGENVNLLVLCSASRRVRGAEASEGGYIQGAADDSEGWSRGLTSRVFWNKKDMLHETPEAELPDLIQRLLREENEEFKEDEVVLVRPTTSIYLGLRTRTSDEGFDLVINCNGHSGTASHRMLDLKCREGKLGSKDLREKLGIAKSFAATTLERDPECRVVITCSTGSDFSVGVALALLCLFFDDSGKLRSVPGPPIIDKSLVKRRLAWITSSKSCANPSRSTLQSVNSFLMDRPN